MEFQCSSLRVVCLVTPTHLSGWVGFLLAFKKVSGPVRTTTCICYISTMEEDKQEKQEPSEKRKKVEAGIAAVIVIPCLIAALLLAIVLLGDPD